MHPNRQITIGLQVVSLGDAYNLALIDSINAAASKFNANLILFLGGTPGHPNYKHAHHQGVIYEHITAENIDVIITLTPTLRNFISEEMFNSILNSMASVPIVSIGFDLSPYRKNQSSILIHSNDAFFQLIENLITEQGYSNLAFISGPLSNPEALMRFDIYKSVLKKHNLELKEDNIYYGTFDSLDAAPALNQFLSKSHTPDAIICSNDLCALEVMEQLAKRYISVPDQIAVTGFDNIDAAKTSSPSLTTVSQSFLKIGALATQLAISHALKKPCEPIYYSDAIFVNRESSGVKSSHRDILQFRNELYQFIIARYQDEKYSSLDRISEPTIYDLLLEIADRIYFTCDASTDRCLIEFEEFYIPIIKKKIKTDIKNHIGNINWINAIINVENKDIKQANKKHVIDLFCLRLREVLSKEQAFIKDIDSSSKDNLYYLKSIVEEISNTKNLQELSLKLREKYKQYLNLINLDNYIIMGYKHPVKKLASTNWLPPEKISVILSFNEIEEQSNIQYQEFDSKILFPKEIISNQNRYTIVVESLYSSDYQLGRVVYELYPNKIELLSCSVITTQISVYLRNIHQ